MLWRERNHHITTLDKKPLKLAVDISNDGLWQDECLYAYAGESQFTINDDHTVSGFSVLQGVKLYFYIACNAKIENVNLWRAGKRLQDRELKTETTKDRFGCIFETKEDTAELRIGFSLISEEQAKKNLSKPTTFDKTKEDAYNTWEKYLSAIELKEASEEDKELFYSNYYHTLTKPCGWAGESFLWAEDEIFYHDYATLWDVYKTQLPFVFSLYEDTGKGIAKTLIRYGKENNGLEVYIIVEMKGKEILRGYIIFCNYRRFV